MSTPPRTPPRGNAAIRTPNIAGAALTGQVGKSDSPRLCFPPLFSQNFTVSRPRIAGRGEIVQVRTWKRPPSPGTHSVPTIHMQTESHRGVDLGDPPCGPCPFLTVVSEWRLMQSIGTSMDVIVRGVYPALALQPLAFSHQGSSSAPQGASAENVLRSSSKMHGV